MLFLDHLNFMLYVYTHLNTKHFSQVVFMNIPRPSIPRGFSCHWISKIISTLTEIFYVAYRWLPNFQAFTTLLELVSLKITEIGHVIATTCVINSLSCVMIVSSPAFFFLYFLHLTRFGRPWPSCWPPFHIKKNISYIITFRTFSIITFISFSLKSTKIVFILIYIFCL